MDTTKGRPVAMRASRPASAGVLGTLITGLVLVGCGRAPQNVDQSVRRGTDMSQTSSDVRDVWIAGIDTLQVRVRALESALVSAEGGQDRKAVAGAQARFHAARLAFKQIEALTAYYEPSTTRTMNGPALPRVDEDEGPEAVFPPEGFQVIEERLFADPDSTGIADALLETRNLQPYVTRLRTAASRQRITDDRVWDAAKLEIARVSTLGITGFDSPVALQSLPEAKAALAGVRTLLAPYRAQLGDSAWQTFDASVSTAISFTETDSAFDRFDRLGFIAHGANPMARRLHDARVRLNISTPVEQRAFRLSAVTIFDRGALDALAFAPPKSEPASPARVALGRDLFFDATLSGSGSTSCATCHDPALAFTDGRTRSAARSGGLSLRNAPTLINAGLQMGSFYDLRATYLEDQVTDVVRNAEEMHSSVENAAQVLARDTSYVRQFATAFPSTVGPAVSGSKLRVAIAAYIRSLEALDSRVDRAFRGDTAALNREERLGLNLFMGKARCATCHFAPLFNGTVPPMYQDSEVEVLGVPATAGSRRMQVDADSGRFRLTRSAPHLFAFRTPGVRNAALTAPYMHNGVYKTLEEVVDFYNHGGATGFGLTLPNQTLPFDSLRLRPLERRAIVKFMQALSDTVGVTSRPDVRQYQFRLRAVAVAANALTQPARVRTQYRSALPPR